MSLKFDELIVHSDHRGVVFEVLEAEMIALQRNMHVVISQPGIVRGNHYHLKGTEIIAVMGPALVRIREDGKLRDIEVAAKKVYRFTFPPNMPHAIKIPGISQTYWLRLTPWSTIRKIRTRFRIF